jgi:uncharacterized protein (DUF1697 family)
VTLVAFLKGVNVGGHRTLRPAVLARELSRLDVVNIGAAGTFVVRGRVTQAELRAAVARRVPFEAEVMICSGRAVLELVSSQPFARRPSRREIVQFVSVMARRPRRPLALPPALPATGRWGLKVIECRGQFVLGLYRREMKAIGHLAQLETFVGAPLATRSWSTMLSVARILEV